MATTNKKISGTYSYSSGTLTYTGGSANYTNLTDASDTTYVQYAGANSYGSWPLEDMPSDLDTVTAVTINIRERQSSAKGDFGDIASIQIFKSDGTTAITSSVTYTDTATITTYNLTPSTINYTDKTSWDGAVIKILQNSGSGAGIIVYDVDIDITYTASGGGGGGGSSASSGNFFQFFL